MTGGGKPKVEMCVCTRAHTCLRVSGIKWKTHEKMNICHVHVTGDQTPQLPSQTSSSCFPHCPIVLPVSRLASMDLSLTSSKLLPSLLFGFFVIIDHPFPFLLSSFWSKFSQSLTRSLAKVSCKGVSINCLRYFQINLPYHGSGGSVTSVLPNAS